MNFIMGVVAIVIGIGLYIFIESRFIRFGTFSGIMQSKFVTAFWCWVGGVVIAMLLGKVLTFIFPIAVILIFIIVFIAVIIRIVRYFTDRKNTEKFENSNKSSDETAMSDKPVDKEKEETTSTVFEKKAYCSMCGKPLLRTHKFCAICGAPNKAFIAEKEVNESK